MLGRTRPEAGRLSGAKDPLTRKASGRLEQWRRPVAQPAEATAPAPPTAANWLAARYKPLRRIDPAIVALTILAFGVAFYHLGAKSLWLDEAASADYTSHGLTGLGHILSGRDQPTASNMGLYYVLLYFWRQLFGSGEIALRSLTLVLGGLAVPVMVLLGTRLFGRAAGLLSGLLLAVSPFFVHYEQTARSYALLVLLVVMSSYFFVRELEQPSRATRVGFVLASALAIYAHYFAALVLLVQFLTLLAVKRRAALTREWLVAAGAIAILCAPEAVFALRKGAGGIDWIPPPSFSSLIDLPSELAGGKVLLITLLILACYGLFCAIDDRRLWRAGFVPAWFDDRRLWRAGFVAAWFLVPVLLVFAVSMLGRPLFVSYYLIVALPALLLLAAAGLVQLPGRASGIVVLGLLIAGSGVGISDWYRRSSLEEYRSATRYILEYERPGDRIIYSPSYIGVHGFAYYEALAGRSGPSEAEPGTRPPRIWLAVRWGGAPPQEIRQSLAGAYAPVATTSQSFTNPVVTLYQARSTPSTTPSSSNVVGPNGLAPAAVALSHYAVAKARATFAGEFANLQPSDLPQGWKLAAPPQDSLAQHVFACLQLLGPDQPETAISVTGPGQLKMIFDVLGWPAATEARSATAVLAQGSSDAKSCVASSPHFVTSDFSIEGLSDAGVEVHRKPSGSVRASKSASRLRPPAAAAKATVVYGLSYHGPLSHHGPTRAARGALVATTRGRATAVILAYRTGEQPLPAKLLPALVAGAYQRLEATAAGH